MNGKTYNVTYYGLEVLTEVDLAEVLEYIGNGVAQGDEADEYEVAPSRLGTADDSTEYRVTFHGREVHVTDDHTKATAYIGRLVAEGASYDGYGVEHRRVTVGPWAPTTKPLVSDLDQVAEFTPGAAVVRDTADGSAYGRVSGVRGNGTVTVVGVRGGATTCLPGELRPLRTADLVPIVEGLRVWTNDVRLGTVELARLDDQGWFRVRLDDGGHSLMNAERVAVKHPRTRQTAASVPVGEAARTEREDDDQ